MCFGEDVKPYTAACGVIVSRAKFEFGSEWFPESGSGQTAGDGICSGRRCQATEPRNRAATARDDGAEKSRGTSSCQVCPPGEAIRGAPTPSQGKAL